MISVVMDNAVIGERSHCVRFGGKTSKGMLRSLRKRPFTSQKHADSSGSLSFAVG